MINFNHDQSGTRMPIERSFGVLKGRWRCLKTPLNFDHITATRVIVACAVLHNVCQLQGEEVRSLLYSPDRGLNAGFHHAAAGAPGNAPTLVEGRRVRDHIRVYLDEVWDR